MKIAIAILALTVAAAQPVLAQGKSKQNHGKNNDKHGNVVTTTKVKANGNAPSFCRSGAGHPKFGRGWCVEKGFGLGNSTWQRDVWSDVVFGSRRSPTVKDVLSSVVLGRLNNYATQQLHLTTPLTGTWLQAAPDRQVYLVRSGTQQVAELVDTNGDGRADYVMLYHR